MAFILAGIPPLFGAFLMFFILKIQRQMKYREKMLFDQNNTTLCVNEVKPSMLIEKDSHKDINQLRESLVNDV